MGEKVLSNQKYFFRIRGFLIVSGSGGPINYVFGHILIVLPEFFSSIFFAALIKSKDPHWIRNRIRIQEAK
jgi:hypothetical protein